jgi:hypothetical protein
MSEPMPDDEPIDLSKERRRRHPFRPRVVSEHEAALAGEYAKAYLAASRATEWRYERAMLNINLDPTIRRAIQAAYEALKNPDSERAG